MAKTLRDIHRPEGCRTTHHCAMSLQNQGVGYDDLNAFLSKPSNLEFTIGNAHKNL